jgi:hypothetical protein
MGCGTSSAHTVQPEHSSTATKTSDKNDRESGKPAGGSSTSLGEKLAAAMGCDTCCPKAVEGAVEACVIETFAQASPSVRTSEYVDNTIVSNESLVEHHPVGEGRPLATQHPISNSMPALIWKAFRDGRISAITASESYQRNTESRGSIFLSYIGENKTEAQSLKVHLESDHQYRVFLCSESQDFDVMQQRIRCLKIIFLSNCPRIKKRSACKLTGVYQP